MPVDPTPAPPAQSPPPPPPPAEDVPKHGAEWGFLARLAAGSNVILQTAIVLALVVGVNYVCKRHYWRKDGTSSLAYTLSDKTRQLVSALKKPIVIATIWAPNSNLEYEVSEKVKDMLEEYAHLSPQIQIKALPAMGNPELFRKMVKDLGIKPSTQGTLDANQVIFISGERQKAVGLDSMFEADFGSNPYAMMGGGGPQGIKSFNAEEVITSSLRNVSEERKLTLYFLEGHHEAAIDGSRERDGAFIFKEKLERSENYEVKKWSSLTQRQVPNDCDLLVVADPRTKILPEELDTLKKYLEGGGRMLCLLEPCSPFTDSEASGIESLVREWGVDCPNGIIVELSDHARIVYDIGIGKVASNNALEFLGTSYGTHPVVSKFTENNPAFFSVARAVDKLASAPPDLEVTSLAKTSAQSFLRVNPKLEDPRPVEGDDRMGPVSVGVAVEKKLPPSAAGEAPRKTRLVVLGDSAQVTNWFDQKFGKSDLVLNAIRWLLEQENMISIEAKKPESHKLDPGMTTEDKLAWVQKITVLLMPACAAALGLAVWILRQR